MAGADFGVDETFDLAFGVVEVDLDFAISSGTVVYDVMPQW